MWRFRLFPVCCFVTINNCYNDTLVEISDHICFRGSVSGPSAVSTDPRAQIHTVLISVALSNVIPPTLFFFTKLSCLFNIFFLSKNIENQPVSFYKSSCGYHDWDLRLQINLERIDTLALLSFPAHEQVYLSPHLLGLVWFPLLVFLSSAFGSCICFVRFIPKCFMFSGAIVNGTF